jgi:hypothetical protein
MTDPSAHRRGRTLLIGAGIVAAFSALPACGWEDRSANADMPWLGSGGRAHLYFRETSCFGCPTGSKAEQRWGRSSWSGEDPYVTVGKAMIFLFTEGGMAKAAKSIGAGTIADGSGIIEPRALPYHMTVVMIEPAVIVMNFDLGALIHEGEVKQGPVVGTPYIDGYLTYGTRVPATGTLLWFSPSAKVAPTPVRDQASGHGVIEVGGIRLALDRQGDAWVVNR